MDQRTSIRTGHTMKVVLGIKTMNTGLVSFISLTHIQQNFYTFSIIPIKCNELK